MKKILLSVFVSVLFICTGFSNASLKDGFKNGNPDIKSINALSFGPEGILFIGDSENAKVFAIDTKDEEPRNEVADFMIERFDQMVAEALGTSLDNITIADMAVNPISKSLYVAVINGSGYSVLLKLEDNETISAIDLTNVSYSDQSLEKAIAADSKDRRGRSLRKWAISDLNYSNGQIMLTGLSNQEFGSTFRAIPFPFDGKQEMSSLEIYHAAHGRYETNSPVKTFTTASIADVNYVVASYTCTPLVIFPASDLKPGKHVKGRTVAELGNRNTPLDMIVMEKNDESYLLMANSSRALMKISLNNIANFNGSLTEPVEESSATAGVDFISLPIVNVLQLDQLDNDRFVMLQRRANGNLTLWTAGKNRWL